MHQFLANQESSKTTIEENKFNGKLSERYFAGILTTALDARVSFTSRTEDDAKLDLVTIMSHPWELNKVEILYTQVKSGESICKVDGTKLKVNKSKFKSLLQRTHNTLVCWTKVDDEEQYWFLIKSNSRFFKTEYDKIHVLSPLTKFDIVRLVTAANNSDGGAGLIFKRKNERYKYSHQEYIELRNRAKSSYSLAKNKEIYNPLFGVVEVTKLGWRHITRESRYCDFKMASYEIIAILKNILKVSPTRHYIIKSIELQRGRECFRELEFLLYYGKVKVFDREQARLMQVDVYVKLLEICSFDRAWKLIPKNTTNVKRRVIFKSIYYK